MSRRRHHGRLGQQKAEINMNSLIDLTFLLLVTFMLTIPALEQGISIMLPKARTDKLPTKDSKANTVSVDAQNQIYFNKDPVTIEQLESILSSKVAEDPDVPVLVRGDERLSYGNVMDVVKIVYKCKVHKMALVTEEK